MAKKTDAEMTDKERWEKYHSDENIQGLKDLDIKEWNEEMMPHARGIAFGLQNLQGRGQHVLKDTERLQNTLDHPETAEQDFQVLEYDLAELVKELAEIMQHAGNIQRILHGMRQSNLTIVRLLKEKAQGSPWEKGETDG
jgi:hypothetical protein